MIFAKKYRASDYGMQEQVFDFDGNRIQIYLPESSTDISDKKLPVVLAMHGTGYDADSVAFGSGWVQLAGKEGFIVLAPNYDAFCDVHDMTGFFAVLVEFVCANYPADRSRVYSTGFSNGGAASVLLAGECPEVFAGISAMGWMLDTDDRKGKLKRYGMPFQVIQGTREFTEKLEGGSVAVMECERDAIRTLMLANGMKSAEHTDYGRTPFYGYLPDREHQVTSEARLWTFRDYHKDGYSYPFAQFVTVEGAKHEVHLYEATAAWEFLKHFSRSAEGTVVEL